MAEFIIAIVCALLAGIFIMLGRVYFEIPVYELKRKARAGDKYASAIFPVVSYGSIARTLLRLIAAILISASIVLFSHIDHSINTILGILLSIFWLCLSYLCLISINKRYHNFSHRLLLIINPVISSVVNFIYPYLVRFHIPTLSNLDLLYVPTNSGLYEIEDLLRLLNAQSTQKDNRISHKQLIRLRKIIEFDQARVGDYLTAKTKLHIVYADDLITPVFLDELHQLKQSSFVVYRSKHALKVAGVLFWQDIGLHTTGKVADYMRLNVEYIQQDELVESALAKMALSGQTLLIAMDSRNHFVGVLSLKDALSALLSLKDVKTSLVEPWKLGDQETVNYNDELKAGELNENIDD